MQQAEIDINRATAIGKSGTALIAACAHGFSSIVKMLLANGADIAFKAEGGEFPAALAAALHSKSLRTVSILINSPSRGDQTLSVLMPGYQDTIDSQRGYFQSRIHVPMLCSEEEGERQCRLAAEQVKIAAIYSLLEIEMDWGDDVIPEALACLRIYSSYGESDYRAAAIMLQVLEFDGDGNADSHLDSLRFELRESDAAETKSGWQEVLASLIRLVHDFENGVRRSPQKTRVDRFGDDFEWTITSPELEEDWDL